ncbi:MAG: hypothetical protein ABIC91_08600 [Nanoarchaeota archaeon]|nr:hypothetical protein [Nanoarchaeota archaeon]MBU1030305.1 hypothetical protein [Nanoarchaeota archaeon]MBU1849318.1 hypothetical protein [Nanoarchaeota archaeon]
MEQTAKQTANQTLEQRLPLVLEIIPGQAAEGLVDIYDPGTYEQTELRTLVNKTLNKEHAVEDAQIATEVRKQLQGGKLLYNGEEIHSKAIDYGVIEKTTQGEEYLYVRLKAIEPQEGGYLR